MGAMLCPGVATGVVKGILLGSAEVGDTATGVGESWAVDTASKLIAMQAMRKLFVKFISSWLISVC